MQHLITNPLVSIVIASYNMGEYLPLAVNSVCAGTYSNIEVIAIDDGSTDNTQELIKPCLADPRVKYIRQDNQGQPKAKNNGLRSTSGEFIAFCDADDLWTPNKLALQLPLFANPAVGVVYSEVSYIDGDGAPYDRPPPYQRYAGQVTDQLLLKNFVPFGTAVMRRACLEKNGYFDEQFRMGIDWDLWLRYSLDWEFAYIPDCTYIYREWSGQMSTNYRGRYEHAFRILEHFEQKYGDRLSRPALKKAWADMFASRADVYARNEKTFWQPLRDILKGVALDPGNIAGWKTLAKIVMRWY